MIDRKLFQRIRGFDPTYKNLRRCRVHFTATTCNTEGSGDICSILCLSKTPQQFHRNRFASGRPPKRFARCVSGIKISRRTWSATRNGLHRILFTYCVQAYPYWTHEHHRTMREVRRQRGGKPVRPFLRRGPKAKLVARLLGWRAGRLANFRATT